MDEMKRLGTLIKKNAPLTWREFAELELRAWRNSPVRKLMQKGVNYYAVQNDILHKRRIAIGWNGEDQPTQVELKNVANNRIAHAFASELADQKIQYLLGRPFSVEGAKGDRASESHAEELVQLLGETFPDILSDWALWAVNCGLGWLHVYFDEEGEIRFKVIPSTEVLPFWRDDAHTKLDALLRTYQTERYTAAQCEKVWKAELWTPEGVRFYELMGDSLVPDPDVVECSGYAERFQTDSDGIPYRPHLIHEGKPSGWGRIPFIALKYNSAEQPLLGRIKSLIDEYDRTVSYDADTLEDQPNSILIVRNYDGTDLGEFRRNLNAYRAIRVSDDGGVETLATPVDVDASNKHLERLRRDIYSFGRGVDMRGDRIGASASGIALKQEYSALDLDVNGLERGVQRALMDLHWFIDRFLGLEEDALEVAFTFSRDIITVETEAVEMCQKSIGIVSERTLLTNHPWIEDVDAEIEELEKERERQLDQSGSGYESVFGGVNGQSGILEKKEPDARGGGSKNS